MRRVVFILLAFSLVLPTAFLGLWSPKPANAEPPLPSAFYGTVKLDGQNVPAGTTVVAYVGGSPYAQATTQTFQGDTVYFISVPGDDPATTAVEGATAGAQVFFAIGNTYWATEIGTWVTGNTNASFNLTASSAPAVTPTSAPPTPMPPTPAPPTPVPPTPAPPTPMPPTPAPPTPVPPTPAPPTPMPPTPAPPTPVPPTPDEGGSIASGQTVSGYVNPSGDRDNWTFYGIRGDRVTIRLNEASGSGLDPYLGLIAPSGALETYDDDSGGNLNSLINNWELRESGTYIIVARGFGSSTGAYTLSFSLTPTALTPTPPTPMPPTPAPPTPMPPTPAPPTPMPPTPAPPTPMPPTPAPSTPMTDEGGSIASGQQVSGYVNPSGDRDNWTFYGNRGDRVSIRLNEASGSGLDPYVELIAPSGRETENDDSGGSLNSLIDNWELRGTGTYTIVARGFGGSTGAYTLSFSLTPTPTITPTPTPTVGPTVTITPTPTPFSGGGGTALPSSFYGTAMVDGANAAEGATVTAWIGGVQVAATNTSAFQGNTVYRLVILSDHPNTAAREGGVEGDALVFKIGDYEAQERAPWRSGTNVELNLNAVSSPSPSVALASIANQLVLVYLYDPSDPLLWKVYDPRAPAYANTLERFERGSGYWIKVNSATTLTYGGRSYPLGPGWNLVGWMG